MAEDITLFVLKLKESVSQKCWHSLGLTRLMGVDIFSDF